MPGTTTSADRSRLRRDNVSRKNTAPPVEELWAALRGAETGQAAARARNLLIQHYLPLVRFHARQVHARLPNEVDVDDLVSVGFFGLLSAIDAFDAGRGVKFETYCAQRVRGAMLDELRSMDWVPRVVRVRTALVRKARNALSMELGRPPTGDEIAAWLDVSPEEYRRIDRDSKEKGVVSLHRTWRDSEGGKDAAEIEVIRDESQADPAEVAQRQDLRDLITRGFSRAERLIIVLYYYEDMTMREIGLTLDLSESRVSQMHASVLRRLRAKMLHREHELTPDEAPAVIGRIP